MTTKGVTFQLAFSLRWTVSTRISTEIDKDENEQKNRKNVKFASNMAITEIIVPTCLHLKFFLKQMWLFKYFINIVV